MRYSKSINNEYPINHTNQNTRKYINPQLKAPKIMPNTIVDTIQNRTDPYPYLPIGVPSNKSITKIYKLQKFYFLRKNKNIQIFYEIYKFFVKNTKINHEFYFL